MRTSFDVPSQRSRKWLLAALGCTALTTPVMVTPALAQTAEGEVDNNTIIVTAQRRSEALEDVPMTVNVLTAETLANTGVTSVRDLSNVTSGFQLGQGGSVPQPAIRGVTSLINGNYENNVAVYIDGIYQTVPAAISIDLPNISSVQVLKGPQGTLYGRNATGGAILIDTINPGDSWAGKAEATYARFNDRRLSTYISGPLTDKIGISIAGYHRRTDGYFKKLSRTVAGKIDGDAFGLDQDAIRVKLAFQLSDSFKATIGGSYLRVADGRGVEFSPLANAPLTYNSPGGRIPGGAVANPGPLLLPTKLGQTAFDFEPTVTPKQKEGFVKLELDTGIGKLQSTTAYQRTTSYTAYDFDGSYLPAFYGVSKPRDTTIQQTLDYNINAIQGLDLIVGGQYFNIKTDNNFPVSQYNGYVFQGLPYTYDGSEIPFGTYTTANQAYFHREKKAWAVYADATVHVSDRLSVNVGGRYSKEKQHVFETKITRPDLPISDPKRFISFTPTDSRAAPGFGADKHSSYSKFTPRASIRYEIAPRTNVYASYSQGFKSGEWNTTFPSDNPRLWFDVKQESIDAYEIGLKTAGHRLQADFAAFYYDYTGLQVSTTTFVPGFGTQTLLQNAPKATIKGAEANFDYELIDNLHIRAGATWLHARYGKNFIFTGVGVNPTAAPGVSPANGNPLNTFVNQNLTQDLSGQQMARAPDFSAYGGIDYLIPNGDGGLRFTANAKYTDSYVVTNPSVWGGDINYDPSKPGETVDNNERLAGTPYASQSNKQRFRQGSYVLVNGSVTWTDPTDHFYIRLWGTNLTDKRYRLHYAGTTTFGTYAPMAEPRSFGATVGFKFREEEAPPPPAPTPPPPPPAPVPTAPVAEVVCNKGPYIVFFDWDKSDITPEAATILDSAIGAYGNCQSVPIMLAGYTDRSGSAKYNQGLSERRNASTRSYLTGRGIPDGAISSQAFGEGNPRVPTADGVRELQNRRVEITYGPGSGM